MPEHSLHSFFDVARTVGKSPAFVQGAGGNISWKNGEKMYVKASGFFMRHLERGRGYTCCAFHPLTNFLRRTRSQARYSQSAENGFNAFIEQHVVHKESFGVPSIETGMHAALARAVIHTHNAYINVFGCMRGGGKLLAEILGNGNVHCLPYRNPGLALAKEISLLAEKGAVPPVIVLMNHGLLTHAEDLDTALRLTLEASDKIKRYLRKKKISPFRVVKTSANFSRHLFPDSVVYSHIDYAALPPEKKEVFWEISSMTNYILAAIRKLGGKPVYLAAQDVRFIQNMGKEKHRIKMLTKNVQSTIVRRA